MPNNRLWLLFARRLSGEASPEESAELQALLQEHPDNQHLLDFLHNYFDLPPADLDDDEVVDDYFEERFKKIVTSDDEVGSSADELPPVLSKKFSIKKFLYYAAAISGISLMGWLTYRMLRPTHEPESKLLKISEVVAKPGARTKLVLPDGSQVWLNSGSKLNYQNDFNSRIREVELEGEAFFDVVPSVGPSGEKIPFIVHASSINITVVGTAFAIKSYPQDETVEATLLRGMIEVTRKDNPNGPKVILKPNEKLIFNKQLETTQHTGTASAADNHQPSAVHDISVTPVSKNIPDSEKVETSWVYNRLVFNGDSFQELAEKMERWYNIKIVFKSNNHLRYRFKGTFANESVQEAFNALQLTAKFSYKINDNEIEIYDKR